MDGYLAVRRRSTERTGSFVDGSVRVINFSRRWRGRSSSATATNSAICCARAAAPGDGVGIDLSLKMLERARARAAEEGVGNVTFVHGDAQVYPFGAGAM